MRKNDVFEMEITGLTAEGNGVGRADSMAVFVPAAAVGDILEVRILKVLKSYAFGKIQRVIKPSGDRIEPDCPRFYQCGGCAFRHLTYEAELRAKEQRVKDAIERIGGVKEYSFRPIVGAISPGRYRNKAQLPFGMDSQGRAALGFFAPHSHRVVPIEGCPLQPERFDRVMALARKWADEYGVPVYDEIAHQGLLRHLYLREASATGELMVCLVVNGNAVPHEGELVQELTANIEGLKSVVLNVNREKTNVILGKKCRVLWGADSIEDRLCALRFAVSPLSFYQVNRDQAQRLYGLAREFAAPGGEDLVLDLYCGAGTIGMCMAADAKKVIGVEIVPEAIEDAKKNARLNGIENVEFLCGDASLAAQKLKERGETPAVVLVDPPRKGCAPELLNTIARLEPKRIVYVSCDPATLARDLKRLSELGYQTQKAAPVDLFPRTAHVEVVIQMTFCGDKQKYRD